MIEKPQSSVSDPLSFLAAQAVSESGTVESCYSPELAREMASAYESNRQERILLADSVERKLKTRYGKEFNVVHFRRTVKIYRAEVAAQRPRRVRKPGVLPEILASNRQLRDVSAEAVVAVTSANDPPFIFVRSGRIAHVVTDEYGRPSVEDAHQDWIRGILSDTADWMRFNQAGEMKSTFPPREVVANIATMSKPPFPALTNVTEVPSMRADGTILDKTGYDRQSGVYYIPADNLKAFPLPDIPTQQDVVTAKALIEEAIGEFPYAEQASKANVYGLLLTPIMRPAILGSTPLAVVDAPQAGTGKSLLIDVVSIITTGRPAAMVPFPWGEEEMQKQIGSSLTCGRQLIVFDNLEGELKSPNLASALTAKEYDARILGFSKNMMVPNKSTWVVTGNNVRLAGDMPRRCYQIRLDARESKPYTGREFKHPDLLRWVTDNRSELLHALLIISRYWFASGCPKPKDQPSMGAFEEWQQKIGGIVNSARVPGFLANYLNFIEQEDDMPRQWTGFLHHLMYVWRTMDPCKSRPFLIKDLMDLLSERESSTRQEAPAEVCDLLENTKRNHRIVLGIMMKKYRARRFGQYWIDRESEEEDESGHKGSSRWVIMMADTQSTS